MGYIKGKLKLREKMTPDELHEKIRELSRPIRTEMFGKKGGFLFSGLESNIQSWLRMNHRFSGVTLVKSLKDETKISSIRIYGEYVEKRCGRFEEKIDHYRPLAEIFDGHIHRTKSPDIYFKDGAMYIGDEGKAELDAYKQKQKDVLKAEELENEEEEER